jgi:hypothetical protein
VKELIQRRGFSRGGVSRSKINLQLWISPKFADSGSKVEFKVKI